MVCVACPLAAFSGSMRPWYRCRKVAITICILYCIVTLLEWKLSQTLNCPQHYYFFLSRVPLQLFDVCCSVKFDQLFQNCREIFNRLRQLPIAKYSYAESFQPFLSLNCCARPVPRPCFVWERVAGRKILPIIPALCSVLAHA